jgi:Holliday junction DNA helicase RuvA
MILSISGTVFEKGETYIGVRVGSGVGYMVLTSPDSDMWAEAEIGGEVEYFTSAQFRENEQSLYGFKTPEERNFFEMLITVSGVGPKLAATLLAHLDRKELAQMILNEDIAGITTVPGIGKKMAERLVVELRDKVLGEPEPEAKKKDRVDTTEEEQFLSQALERLGFSARERDGMLEGAREHLAEGTSVEDVLKKLLSGSSE